MRSSLIRLLIMPAIGLLLFATALGWSRREIRLRLQGEAVVGRVAGMAVVRANGSDLILSRDLSLKFTLRDGAVLETRHRDNMPVFGRFRPGAGGAPALLPADALPPDNPASPLPRSVREVVRSVVEGEAAHIRWALQREARRADDPHRVVQIELVEEVSGAFGMTELPEELPVVAGRVTLPAGLTPGTAKVTATFDHRDDARVRQAKGETLVAYRYERLDRERTPERRNLFLFAEPYPSEFRPLFTYPAEDRERARLSHIGRQGGPTLALRLFAPCRVYLDPAQPGEAMLAAMPGPVAGKPLEWFSRACEGLFSQWGSTALIVLAGILFTGSGLVMASLRWFPSRNQSLD